MSIFIANSSDILRGCMYALTTTVVQLRGSVMVFMDARNLYLLRESQLIQPLSLRNFSSLVRLVPVDSLQAFTSVRIVHIAVHLRDSGAFENKLPHLLAPSECYSPNSSSQRYCRACLR